MSFDELKGVLVENHGVLSVSMERLRLACGAGRLGRNVNQAISHELKRRGMGHYPPELPNRQNDLVRLYTLDGPVDHIIEALSTVDEKHDEILRRALTEKSACILSQVQEIVCSGLLTTG